jgi:hypothetical protein
MIRETAVRFRALGALASGSLTLIVWATLIGTPLLGVGYFIDHGWPALIEYRVKWVCRDAIPDPNRLLLSEASREVENIAIERCVYAIRSAGGLHKLPEVSRMMCSGSRRAPIHDYIQAPYCANL